MLLKYVFQNFNFNKNIIFTFLFMYNFTKKIKKWNLKI